MLVQKTNIESYYPVVIRPYKALSDKNLDSMTGKIASAMDKNPNFPTLDLMVADYIVFQTTFSDLVKKAAFRDSIVIAAKNKARTKLIQASIDLGIAVENVAAGDLEMLISSKLPLKKIPQKTVLPLPQNLIVTTGINAGELITKIDRIRGAMYVISYALFNTEGTKAWQSVNTTRSKYVLKGLTVGARYYIKVGAIGPNNTIAWSVEILSPFVQERGDQ